MQPELPWNVAGIPTEAREAARVAARREGLSLGEWMTRRILSGFPELASEHEARKPWAGSREEPVLPADPIPHHSPHEIGEIPAEISRGREPAPAPGHMSAHMEQLAERLLRIERHMERDSMREAVKAIHQGLSRVAVQTANTASQSGSQIAALATTVDSLAGQVVSTGQKADTAMQAAEAHFTSLDQRTRLLERSASALENAMSEMESLRASMASTESDVHENAAAAVQLRTQFEQLRRQVAANEATQGSIATRLEAVAQLQSPESENSLDRHLQGIEHALSDIMDRLEKTERTTATTTGSVEQTLRVLTASLEAADRLNRDTVRELQAAVKETQLKIAAVEDRLSSEPLSSPQPVTTAVAEPAPPIKADRAMPAKMIPDAPAYTEEMPPPRYFESDLPPLSSADILPSPAFNESFAASEGFVSAPESFLSAARRAASAAAEKEEEENQQPGIFPWSASGKYESRVPKPDRKRFAVAASIFAAAVVAALGGVMLTRGAGSTASHIPLIVATNQPAPVRSGTLVAAKTASVTVAGRDATSSAPSTQTAAHSAQADVADASAHGAVPAARPTGAAQTTAVTAIGAAPHVAAMNSPTQHLIALANTGDSSAQLLLGLKYLDGNATQINEAEAARWLARAAQQGEPLAQYRLGTLYERGRGVPVDAKQATHWYELAAKQGNRKAMHNLAVAFAQGSGEPKDDAQAALWFARAANLGLVDSQFNLAVLYERGMGVKQSLADAYRWYLIAAAQGDAESKSRAEALATQLKDSDRAAAQTAAVGFKPQLLLPAANSPPASG